MTIPLTKEELEIEDTIEKGGNIEAFFRYKSHSGKEEVSQESLDALKSMIYLDNQKDSKPFQQRVNYISPNPIQDMYNLGFEMIHNFYKLIGLED